MKKNLIYQTGYQLLATALPLVTSPYLSRVLGAEQLGTYSYIATIANYFSTVAALGLVTHGTRCIAEAKNEPDRANKVYSQIRTLQLIISSIVLACYLLFVTAFIKENKVVYYIQALWIINCGFDITWLFNGEEDFKTTVRKNLIIKAITLVGIFALVHEPSDMPIYALLLVCSTLFSNLSLFWSAKRYISFGDRSVNVKESLVHLKPALLLFIPTLGTTLYHQMDKTMLGILSTYTQVGYYYNADKIVNISIGIVTGFGLVSLPRATLLLAEGKKKEYISIVRKSVMLMICMASALCFGIAAVANEFTPWFFGEEFRASSSLVAVLPFVMIFKAGTVVVRDEYLIPTRNDKSYIIAVFLGAFINLIINATLIPKYEAMGATIATIISECCVCVMQMFIMQKDYPIFRICLNNCIYVIFGAIMYVVVRIVSNIVVASDIITLATEIIVGGLVYIVLCLVYWKVTKNNDVIDAVKGLIHRGK